MLFSTAEIEVLRLAGRLKAIPLDLGGFDTGLFSPAGIDGLCLYKLLYPTRNGRYLRLTPAGWELLYGLGYPYPKDACYITDPQKLRRRDEAAKLLFTCYRAGRHARAAVTAAGLPLLRGRPQEHGCYRREGLGGLPHGRDRPARPNRLYVALHGRAGTAFPERNVPVS